MRVWYIFRIFCFFLVDCLGGWNQWMWLVSCRRQGMLTQGHAPDLIINQSIINRSFINPYITTSGRLSHFCQECHGHCLVTVNDGRWKGWGWLIYVRLWLWGRRCVSSFLFYFLLSFWVAANCLLVHGSFLVCFFVPFCFLCFWSL